MKPYVSEAHYDINRILHPKPCADIVQADPKPIRADAERCIQGPCQPSQRNAALRRWGAYISGCKFLWLNVMPDALLMPDLIGNPRCEMRDAGRVIPDGFVALDAARVGPTSFAACNDQHKR